MASAGSRCIPVNLAEGGDNSRWAEERQPIRLVTSPGDLAPNHNLHADISSFVGRQSELAAIRGLLQSSRLVTLTGPGGIGKSRLAVEVAGSDRREFADGVWLVELPAVSEPELVPQTVAATLGLVEDISVPPLDALLNFLRRRTLCWCWTIANI